MGANPRVRCIAALSIGDRVRCPSGLEAVVTGFADGRVMLTYVGGGDVTLTPLLLELVAKAPPHKPAPAFLAGIDTVRKGAA